MARLAHPRKWVNIGGRGCEGASSDKPLAMVVEPLGASLTLAHILGAGFALYPSDAALVAGNVLILSSSVDCSGRGRIGKHYLLESRHSVRCDGGRLG